MNSQSQVRLKTQNGLATLLVAIMILVIMGILTLYTNRSVFIEQRTSTNQYKRTLAFETAQSGLEQFMGEFSSTDDTINYKKYLDEDKTKGEWILKTAYDNSAKFNSAGYINANTKIGHNFKTDGLIIAKEIALASPKIKTDTGTADLNTQAQRYQVYLSSIAATNPGEKPRLRIVSRGCADYETKDGKLVCDYAEAFVMTEFTITETKICPLDINGKLTTKNGPSIHAITDIKNNPDNAAKYNCGLSLGAQPTNTGSATGKSASTDPKLNGINDIMGCSGDNCGSKEKEYDPRYNIQSDPNKENHYKKYFNETFAETAAKSSTCVINGNTDSAGLASALSGTCAGKTNVLVTGNFNANGNMGLSNFYAIPALTLIVGGDFTISAATATLNGFLYVRGNTVSSMSGTFSIYGGAAFGGDVDTEMSFAVYADAKKAKIPAGGGLTASFASGSWRDF